MAGCPQCDAPIQSVGAQGDTVMITCTNGHSNPNGTVTEDREGDHGGDKK